MNVGFDFDKVLINYPPFIPYKFVDFLYKGKSVFDKNSNQKTLEYRFPGIIEQKIRIFSHFSFFRQPIEKNIRVLKKISDNKKNKTYLISSRFGFLKKRTDALIEKNNLKKYFNGVYFNYENKQPHIFKEQIIRKLKIDIYIDDDLDLALYLADKFPNLKIVWLIDNIDKKIKLPKNVQQLSELKKITSLF